MGAENALLHDEDGCVARLREGRKVRTWRARLAPREGLSTVGSGDSFLAGFLAGWYAKEPAEAALRLGVACGAANTQILGAGVFDPGDVEAFARQVEVAALE
jgi:fructose-1-phosphate kinase PfkB-like protein